MICLRLSNATIGAIVDLGLKVEGVLANGIRLKGVFESQSGHAHEVLLIQEGWVGIVHEVYVQKGFDLSYSGSDRFEEMRASKGTVVFIIENVSHQAVIDDFIASGDEGLWTLTFANDDGLLWAGQPLMEGVELEDVDYPYGVKITAGCGLKLLKDQKYSPSIAMDELVKLRDVVTEVLRSTPVGRSCIDAIYGPRQISYNCGWTSDGVDYWDTYVKYWSLVDVNDLGFIEHRDCYKLLESLLTASGSRIWLGNLAEVQNGWFIGQVDQLDTNPTTWDIYDMTGGVVSLNQSVLTDEVLVQASGSARLAGGSWTFDPVLRSASAQYDHKTYINYLGGVTASNNTPTYVPPQTIGVIPGVSVMSMTGVINVTINNLTLPSYTAVSVVFRIAIGIGVDNLKRSISVSGTTISYSPAAWSGAGSGSFYYVGVGYFLQAATGDSGTLTIPVSILTPPVPGDGGEFNFDIEFVEIKKYDGTVVTSAQATVNWSYGNATAIVLYGGANTLVVDATKYTVVNNDAPASSDQVQLTTKWGDGPTPNSRGALFIPDGAGYTITTLWDRAGSTGSNNLTRVLCLAYLDHRRLPRRRYQGSIWSRATFVYAIVIDGVRYLPADVTYHADTETWTGSWVEVAKLAGDNGFNGPILIGPGGTTIDNDTIEGEGLVSTGVANVLLNVNTINTISDTIEPGTITTIGVNDQMAGDTIVAGQELTIYNTLTNTQTNVTVVNDVADGDTTITVTGTADEAIPEGALIFVNQITNYTIGGSVAPTLVEKSVTDSGSGVVLLSRQFGKAKPTLVVAGNVITIVSPVSIRVLTMALTFPSSYSDELLRDGFVIDYTQTGYAGAMGLHADTYVADGGGGLWRMIEAVPSMDALGAGHCVLRCQIFGGVQADGRIFVHII
jgi:hypothetical protein